MDFTNWYDSGDPRKSQYQSYSPHLQNFESWVLSNYGGQDVGGYNVRKTTSGSAWSAHAFGSAWDWSYNDRAQGLQLVDAIVANPDAYGIQEIHDYAGGRVWKSNRGWKAQPYGSHGGAMGKSGNTWFEFQVSAGSWGRQGWTGPGTGGGGAGTQFGAPMTAANQPPPQVELPRDTKLVRTPYGIFAVYDLGGGVFSHFGVEWWNGSVKFDENDVETVSQATWDQRYSGSVYGGSAAELGTVNQTFGTFSAFWESVLAQTIGFTNPARNDPEVRKVLAEFAGRPDMSQAELENRLKATSWWNTRTEGQLEWNNLSDAEKQVRLSEMSSRMEDVWFQMTGQDLQFTDPAYSQNVEKLASGALAFGQWQESVVKPEALKNSESPWSRTVRTEQESQRERGVSIENAMVKVREQARVWGLQWDDETLKHWATGLIEKTLSDDDLTKQLQGLAQVAYPWKEPGQETLSAAQPWIGAYSQTMEREGDLFTPEVQAALTAGKNVWDFEQDLRKSAEWMNTQNGQAQMHEAISETGKMFGFAA